MAETWRYRGQEITSEQVTLLREFIQVHPASSRWKLSRQLCEEWGWKQANGALRDVVCRGLLLLLERAGQIELPPVRWQIQGQCRTQRRRPEALLLDTAPLAMALWELGPIEITQVRRTADEPLFNSLLEHHHYLGYEQPVGEHLKYMAWAQGRPLACLGWSSAPRHLGSRDRFIGWSGQARRRNIRLIAYNTRFLILPWVQVPHLASHLLSRMARRLSPDWERIYGHPIYFLETFVDPERFRGTCYRAANWVVLGRTTGRGKDDQTHRPNRSLKEVLGYPLTPRFRQAPRGRGMRLPGSDEVPRLDVSTEELEALVEQARAVLPEDGYQKLLGAVHTLRYVTELLKKKEASLANLRELLCAATTEKTEKVLKQAGIDSGPEKPPTAPEARGARRKACGHGRNGAAAYSGAQKIPVPHASLKPGDACPDGCGGKVYPQREPGVLVRSKGQPPLAAMVYELEKLRCNLCGNVYSAAAPPEAGEKKYDETAVIMMAVLRYGAGVPWNRTEGLEANFGIPLPAATQCEILTANAVPLQPALEELKRQAAQSEVVHNDDTSMRVLSLDGDTDISPERTGVFTSGLVWILQKLRVALYFTGCKHAGENLAEVLKLRSPELPPIIQMCDALSRNVPKIVETLVANCNAHGRRNFVKVTASFPEPCRFVLETFREIYGYDAVARQQDLSAEERLAFHQEHSKPVMEKLHAWLEAQFDERRVEPNSGLGQAISYLLNHWQKLTLFLEKAGVPVDNNIVERALKKAILHRKNSLFYKTRKGAQMGDLFMSLIHTCELNDVNAFNYLTELLRHTGELRQNPSEWMPWNYRDTLARLAALAAA